jgi:hypothetical protein
VPAREPVTVVSRCPHPTIYWVSGATRRGSSPWRVVDECVAVGRISRGEASAAGSESESAWERLTQRAGALCLFERDHCGRAGEARVRAALRSGSLADRERAPMPGASMPGAGCVRAGR